jgi:PAS domain S-box-containing protein
MSDAVTSAQPGAAPPSTATPPVSTASAAKDPKDPQAHQPALSGAEDSRVDLSAIVAQVQDYAIIGLDPQGIIVSWNAGAERMKGYTRAEAIDRHFSMFYRPEDRRAGRPAELLARAAAEGKAQDVGWRLRQDGTRFWAEVSITALHDDAGRLTGYAKVTRDRTEHHELEAALRESEERLRFLVNQVSDYAIIALDPQGTVVSWNIGAERMKGYRADEIIGRHFSVFYAPDDRRAGLPARLLGEARQHGHVRHAGWRVRQDGTRFWTEVSITALHDDSGRLTGFAKVTRDRSDVKALEQAQESFYAAFRHDVATPVFALQLTLDALRDLADLTTDGVHAQMTDLLDRADKNVDRLDRMMRDLVGFAQLRAGQAALRPEPVDVRLLTHQVVAALPDAGDGARVQVGPSVVPAVRADVGALTRILSNLISNALKYSPDDSPIDIRFAADHGMVQILVIDRGRGIHADDLDTIFDEFERGKLAENDGGTGLGLASVKALVLQQQGYVHLDSEVGRGTTVSVSLPEA